ncbi:type IX secretion system motor protein PorM/GldM [Flavobacterium sp.]|uniref:type IX secretion system motor protein PorM/GldM n=1 Tax=Flavobacterium sp. TaxID=239 RepID=UPI0040484167
MAGGKLTPRQKMINLMYLVFIAMLALNMSKEVLSAFGLMNEKFEVINSDAKESNAAIFDQLKSKAEDAPAQFKGPYDIAVKVKPLTDEMFKFIETIKTDINKSFPLEESGANKGKLPYEAMDKSTIDEVWFQGDGYSPKGKEITGKIDAFRNNVKAVFGNDVKYKVFLEKFEKTFNTNDVIDGEGVKKKYLDYHFKGFPTIATVSKLTAMQNDVKKAEQDIYNLLLGNTMEAAISMKKYKAIVVFDKNVVFQGEEVSGRVVLGKYDDSTVPTSFNVNGANSKIENGQAVFKTVGGAVGEKDIKGQFVFTEDGKPVPIEFEGQYVVVPKPNQAIISADKMNVVYRGVPNPISVSVPGISSDKVKASAPGMSAGPKPGQYILKAGSGSEVTINVTATLPDGKSFTSKQAFRIKGLPAPVGKVGGLDKNKGPKSNLEVCSVTAVMEDFDFPVTVNVTQFNIKVPGQPTIVVNGSKMDSRARSAIAKASKGDVVIINEIKANFVGIDQVAKRVSACTYEIQ